MQDVRHPDGMNMDPTLSWFVSTGQTRIDKYRDRGNRLCPFQATAGTLYWWFVAAMEQYRPQESIQYQERTDPRQSLSALTRQIYNNVRRHPQIMHRQNSWQGAWRIGNLAKQGMNCTARLSERSTFKKPALAVGQKQDGCICLICGCRDDCALANKP